MRRVTERFSEPVPGYSDFAVFDETKSLAAASSVQQTLALADWDTYIFTDVDVKFSFAISNNQLDVKGDPYYAFLQLDEENKTSKFNKELTEQLRSDTIVQQLNPKIYELDRKLFRITAVLRYLKTEYKEQWNALVKSAANINPEPLMKTPRAWRP